MTKKTKLNSEIEFIVQLLQDSELEGEMGEAYSSILINPAVSWAKFILTDDAPNANRQRIPVEEFANLIKTGMYMPVKMARGEIRDGHEDSEPLGVMTHLKHDGNKIAVIAALWSKERPADIEYIKSQLDGNNPVNVSWEILYGDSSVDDRGVEDLHDVALRAATIVGMPAYAGRTQMLAVAARKWSPAYIKALPDNCFLLKDRQLPYKDLEGKIEVSRFPDILEEMKTISLPENELKVARTKLKRLKEMMESGASLKEIEGELELDLTVKTVHPEMEDNKLEELKEMQDKFASLEETLASKEKEISDLKLEITRLTEESTAKETELASLKEFKLAADNKIVAESKLKEIQTKFNDAGVEKAEDYFTQNSEFLLGLEEAQLDFMIQELVSFTKETENTESASKKKIPNLQVEQKSTDVKHIAEELRKRTSR